MPGPIFSKPMKGSYSWMVRCTVTAATFSGGCAAYYLWRGCAENAWPFLLPCIVMALLAASFVAWWRQARRQRITIDPENETVIFKNFSVARSFWRNPPMPEFRCRFSEILDAHSAPGAPGRAELTIVTKRGVVKVDSTMSHFEEIREMLFAASRETPPGPIYENPWFLLLVILLAAALIIGLICWAKG